MADDTLANLMRYVAGPPLGRPPPTRALTLRPDPRPSTRILNLNLCPVPFDPDPDARPHGPPRRPQDNGLLQR